MSKRELVVAMGLPFSTTACSPDVSSFPTSHLHALKLDFCCEHHYDVLQHELTVELKKWVESENGRGLNKTPTNTYQGKINKSMVYFLASSTICFAYSRTWCKQNLGKT